MTEQQTTTTYPLQPENIPTALTERPQWVCWRLETRDDKPTKVPYSPDGERASSTDLLTWTPFSDALNAWMCAQDPEIEGVPRFDGIGFVFCSGDPFVGIDMDGCRDAESGEVAPWASRLLDRVVEGYAEVSPSQTGIHVFTKGKLREGAVQRKMPDGGKIEMYSRERFFTVTGVLL